MLSGTYAVAQLKGSIRGEEKHVRTILTITSHKTRRCLMITLCYQTQPSLTRTCTNRLSPPPSAHSLRCQKPTQCSWAAKRFIKTSKKRERSVSPAASVWEDFYGNLELDFLCNLYSWVIFSHPVQSAEAAVICVFLNTTQRRRG